MKTIIAGSRQIFQDHPPIYYVADAVIKSGFKITEVVSGGARGVDVAGEEFAAERGIPVKRFIPDWSRLGRKAGIMRNCQMADYAEALIAVWDGSSRGTRHMIDEAKRKGLKVFVLIPGSSEKEETTGWVGDLPGPGVSGKLLI